MTKAKDLGGGKHQGKVERNPRWVSGELPGWGSEGEKRAIKRERRWLWRGEREGRANTGSLICSSSAFSVRRMNLMS